MLREISQSWAPLPEEVKQKFRDIRETEFTEYQKASQMYEERLSADREASEKLRKLEEKLKRISKADVENSG